MLVRALRPDRLIPGIILFVAMKFGEEFVSPPPFDLEGSFAGPFKFIIYSVCIVFRIYYILFYMICCRSWSSVYYVFRMFHLEIEWLLLSLGVGSLFGCMIMINISNANIIHSTSYIDSLLFLSFRRLIYDFPSQYPYRSDSCNSLVLAL